MTGLRAAAVPGASRSNKQTARHQRQDRLIADPPDLSVVPGDAPPLEHACPVRVAVDGETGARFPVVELEPPAGGAVYGPPDVERPGAFVERDVEAPELAPRAQSVVGVPE